MPLYIPVGNGPCVLHASGKKSARSRDGVHTVEQIARVCHYYTAISARLIERLRAERGDLAVCTYASLSCIV